MTQALPIMNILRVPPRGQLVVELDGKQYQRLADIPDEKLRRRAMAAIGELISFAGSYQDLVDSGYAPPPLPPPEAPVQTEAEISAAQAAFLAGLEKQTDEVRQSLAADPKGRAAFAAAWPPAERQRERGNSGRSHVSAAANQSGISRRAAAYGRGAD